MYDYEFMIFSLFIILAINVCMHLLISLAGKFRPAILMENQTLTVCLIFLAEGIKYLAAKKVFPDWLSIVLEFSVVCGKVFLSYALC